MELQVKEGVVCSLAWLGRKVAASGGMDEAECVGVSTILDGIRMVLTDRGARS